MASFNRRFPATDCLISILNHSDSTALYELRVRVAAVAAFLAGRATQIPMEDLLQLVHEEFNHLRTLRQFGVSELHRQAFANFDAEARAALSSPEWSTASKVAGVGLMVVGGAVVAPALAVGALNIIGFSAAGPVAGSIAAGIQSAVYGGSVGAGSAFALAQSAAMGGIVVGGAAEVAAGVAAVGAGIGLMKKKKKSEGAGGRTGEDDEDSGDDDSGPGRPAQETTQPDNQEKEISHEGSREKAAVGTRLQQLFQKR